MLGIIVDAVLLMFLLSVFKPDDAPDFLSLLLAAAILTALNFGAAFAAGLLELRFAGLVLILAVDAAFLRWWSHLTWPKAATAAVVLVAAKVGLYCLIAG